MKHDRGDARALKPAPTHPIEVKETKRFEIASKHIRLTSLDDDASRVKLHIVEGGEVECIVDIAELLDVAAKLSAYDKRPVMR